MKKRALLLPLAAMMALMLLFSVAFATDTSKAGRAIETARSATLAPGAYDANGVMLASWDKLVNTYKLNIEMDYTSSTYTTGKSMYYVLTKNSALKNTTKVIIGDGVSKIGNYAFSSCSKLTSIDIPSGVTSIGNATFAGCKALTSIEIPSGVTSIGSQTFSGCISLASIEIPSSVTSIDDNAFCNCIKLTSIKIHSSVTSIGVSAFSGCYKLTDVYYTSSESKWSAISIGSSNTYLTNATKHYNSTMPT